MNIASAQILGLVQTLMMSKMTDHYAFGILNSLICHVPTAKFPEFLPVLTNAALDRFQKLPPASNGKFLRCLIVFFSLYMAKHGPEMLLDQVRPRNLNPTEPSSHTSRALNPDFPAESSTCNSDV